MWSCQAPLQRAARPNGGSRPPLPLSLLWPPVAHTARAWSGESAFHFGFRVIERGMEQPPTMPSTGQHATGAAMAAGRTTGARNRQLSALSPPACCRPGHSRWIGSSRAPDHRAARPVHKRLMEQPRHVSNENKIIDGLLVAEMLSGGASQSSSTRKTRASALDDDRSSPRASVNTPSPRTIGTGCRFQDLGTDHFLLQAHQLRGDLDPTLDIPSEALGLPLQAPMAQA